MTEPAQPRHIPIRRWTGFIIGTCWVAIGLLLPIAIGLVAPEQLIGDTVMLAIVLAIFTIVGANTALRFSAKLDDTGFSPVELPIVIAAVTCTPAQTMLIASLGYLLDRTGWQRIRRSTEEAGLAAVSAGLTALLVQSLGLTFDSHLDTITAALVGSVTFLLLDALTYTIWYHFESRTGGDILRYFVGVAPLNISFTAIGAILAGPFFEHPEMVAATLASCQILIYLLYRMATSEARHREKSDHLRDTFGRYVPEAIVEQLSDAGTRIHLGGEQREVSVMFCDIRGFTTWAEGQQPEQVVGELNGLLGSLAALVLESGGTLDKFTGDGLMAFWGAPVDQPDHAARACETAFAMQQLLVERAADDTVTPFRIGIGITSGSVVVGNVGHEQRLEYTAIGDTVNLAARLEQSTKELEITTALAHETWVLLPEDLQRRCPEASTVHVRGRTQPVRVHELAGTVDDLESSDEPELHAL